MHPNDNENHEEAAVRVVQETADKAEQTAPESDKDQKVAEIIENATNMSSEELDDMIAKVEVESQFRDLRGFFGIVVAVLSVMMAIFHFWLAGFSPITGSKARIIHLAFALCLTFLVYPISKKWNKLTLYDVLLAIAGATVNIYLFLNVDRIALNAGTLTTLDLIMGGITIVLVILGARRALGPALSIISVIALLYAITCTSRSRASTARRSALRLATYSCLSCLACFCLRPA